MTIPEIQVFQQKLLTQFRRRHGRSIHVLEWGSGGSTVYFTDVLRFGEMPYTWLSVEHNPEWEKVTRFHVGDAADIVLLNPTTVDPREDRSLSMDDYVGYPATLGRKWDLIFVDGRHRRRCVLEAAQLLTPRGVVFLHDADRPQYQCAFSAFRDQQILPGTSFWEGRTPKLT